MFQRVCLQSKGASAFISTRKASALSAKPKKRNYPRYTDPNYPKRPLNAYLRFWLQFQPEFMEKNKNINLAKSAKLAGSEWYHLGESQRKEYKAESEQEWIDFRKQIEQYKADDGYTKWKEVKKSLPTKMYPKSPVAIYIRENYRRSEERSNKEVLTQLAEQWTQESEFGQSKYKQIWTKEKEEFMSKYGQYLR